MTDSVPVPPAPASTPTPPPAKRPVPAKEWSPARTRALRWTTGLLAVFALGIVALWLVQVQPLRRQVAALEQESRSLQARADDLQAEAVRLKGVEAENTSLKAAKVESELRTALLRAKIGAVQAQFVLASGGETKAAAAALSSADLQLEFLEQALTGAQQESVRALRYRLAMASEETASNPFAAQRDLEVLVDGLGTMEKELAGG